MRRVRLDFHYLGKHIILQNDDDKAYVSISHAKPTVFIMNVKAALKIMKKL